MIGTEVSHTRLGWKRGVFGSLHVTLYLCLNKVVEPSSVSLLSVSVSTRSHSPLSAVGVLGHCVIPHKLAVAAQWVPGPLPGGELLFSSPSAWLAPF